MAFPIGYYNMDISLMPCPGLGWFEFSCIPRLATVYARRSNQSILKEISSEYLMEGLKLKLKLQYFGHLMQRIDSLEKTLMLGKIEGRRRRGWQDKMVGWHHWLKGHEFEQALGVGDGQGRLACYSPWGLKESDTTELLNWNLRMGKWTPKLDFVLVWEGGRDVLIPRTSGKILQL